MLDLLRRYLNVINDEGSDGLKGIMTPDFKLKVAPKSLGLPPPDGLDAYIEFLKGTQKAMGTKNLNLFLAQGFEPIIDEESHRMVLHLQSTADSNFGPVENEFIIILKTTADGCKIKEQHEFMDSAAFSTLMGKVKQNQEQD